MHEEQRMKSRMERVGCGDERRNMDHREWVKPCEVE